MVRFWVYFKVELTRFANGLDAGCEGKRGVKCDCKGSGLSSWKGEGAFS